MKLDKDIGYKFEPEKFMFGMCEEFEGSLDSGADPAVTIDLISLLGARSMRVWMHHKRLLERIPGTDKIVWKQDVLARYKSYVKALTEKGIRILAMNHNYLFPESFDGDRNSVSEMPLPGSKAYFDQMNMLTEAYRMMASEFPEIVYWECGNEVNMNHYLSKPGYSPGGMGNAAYVPEFCYTNLEKAQITADICYYSTLGVKSGNKNAFVVFPAPTPYRGYAEMAEFYAHFYNAVASGTFPRGLKPDTDPGNYFHVHCWHAYNFGGDAELIKNGTEMIRGVIKRFKDDGKKAFVSEFGYHDSDFIKTRDLSRHESDKIQASFFRTDFEAFKASDWIETVFVFRLYDWIAGPGIEIDFGLFTSPSSDTGIVPKEKGKELFKLINGRGADISILYKYKKDNEKA